MQSLTRAHRAYIPVLGVIIGLSLPHLAFAHMEQRFDIGGEEYSFHIGSLNEPITVDDKTGVDLRVSKLGHGHADDHGDPVAGLEDTLKVELIAGDKKKIQSFSPVYNTPGAYKTTFYPTVATTLTYRVFGELNGTQIDLPFSCSPAGHAAAEENTERVQISDSVARTFASGSFGCPSEKADLGFPEASAELTTLKIAPPDNRIAYAALVLAFLALAATFVRRRA